MIFSNYKDIATTSSKKEILDIADNAIRRIQSKKIISKALKFGDNRLIVNNKEFSIVNKRIFIIGAGKASAEMAHEAENIIGIDNITDGIVITNDTEVSPKKIKIHIADHPIPSERGLEGAKKIFDLKEKHNINENDLIIAFVSGGGSALAPYPVDGISLSDKKIIYDLFIKHAVAGFESTIIKTKISRIKGGGLARHFHPATIISLILSDDNGISGDEFTASGPFTLHSSKHTDAITVIDKYEMRNKTPESIISYLEKNTKTEEENENFEHIHQFVLANNRNLIKEVVKIAEKKNITTIVKSNIEGEAKDVAYDFCNKIKKINFKEPILLLYGGETTVTLPKNHGTGGRNQEFVTACLKYLRDMGISRKWSLASIATDGVDFIRESAGGIISNESLEIIKKKNINIDEYLNKHDSHNLLKLINSNIIAHPTETNVGDIMMFYIN